MRCFIVYICLFFALNIACNSKPKTSKLKKESVKEVSIWVNAFKQICPEDPNVYLMAITENYDAFTPMPWNELVSNIEGFDFQWGLLQRIRVEKSDVEFDYLTDSCTSLYTYKYLETLDTLWDERTGLQNIWGLKTIHGKVFKGKPVMMEINLSHMKMHMSGLCVETTMPIRTLGQKELKFGSRETLGMKDDCLAENDNAVLDELIFVNSFKREKNNLSLLNKQAQVILEFVKID